MDVAYFRFQESIVRGAEGRHLEAATAAGEAVAIGRAAGLPTMQVPHFLVRHALCRVMCNESKARGRCYDEAVSLANGVDRRNFEIQRGLIRAHLAMARGDRAGGGGGARAMAAGVPARTRTTASCARRRASRRRCSRSRSRRASRRRSCAR